MAIIKTSGSLLKHNCVFKGYASDVPYLYYKDGGGIIDGSGRQHINLYGRCDICDKEILVAKTHVKEDSTLYGIENIKN